MSAGPSVNANASAHAGGGVRRDDRAARRARRDRIVYPVVVAVVLLALWQGLVTGLELPHYLVPSPLLVLQTEAAVAAEASHQVLQMVVLE